MRIKFKINGLTRNTLQIPLSNSTHLTEGHLNGICENMKNKSITDAVEDPTSDNPKPSL